MDTRTSTVRVRIEQLRDCLRQRGVHALLVPSADPHLSEYLPQRWQTRVWLSGFTGSMGTLAVTLDQAVLFADSRYWEQAELELAGSGIELVKIATGAATVYVDWLAQNLERGQTLSVDGQVLSLASAQLLNQALQRKGIALKTDWDAAAEIWDDRPALPAQPIYEHQPPHASLSRQDKLAQVREAMSRHGATHHFISTVDDIAWLTNLRGSDVTYNPVFLAHLLMDAQSATLYVGAGKVDAALRERLKGDGIQLGDYTQAGAALQALGPHDTLLVDPKIGRAHV